MDSRRAAARGGSLKADDLLKGEAGESCSSGGLAAEPASIPIAPAKPWCDGGPFTESLDNAPDVSYEDRQPDRGASVRSVDQPTMLQRPTSLAVLVGR